MNTYVVDGSFLSNMMKQMNQAEEKSRNSNVEKCSKTIESASSVDEKVRLLVNIAGRNFKFMQQFIGYFDLNSPQFTREIIPYETLIKDTWKTLIDEAKVKDVEN